MRAHAVAGPWPAGDRVLALVGRDAGAEAVVRQAKRLSDALRAPWIALHFERADTVEDGLPALDMAAQLGATVEIRASGDLVGTVLEMARAQNATHLVIGRGTPNVWRRLFGRTLAGTLVREGPEFTLHVVPMAARPPPARVVDDLPRGWLPWVLAPLPLVGVTLAGEFFSRWLEHEALGMLFLAAVVGAATLWGLTIAVYVAVLGFLAWNYFFIPPVYQLTIREPRDVIAALVFGGVAVATGWLASRLRRSAAEASQGRIESLRRITAFSRRLGAPATEAELLDEVARLAGEIASPALMLMTEGEDLNIRAASPPHIDTMDEGKLGRGALGRLAPGASGPRHGDAARCGVALLSNAPRSGRPLARWACGRTSRWARARRRPCSRWPTRLLPRWSGCAWPPMPRAPRLRRRRRNCARRCSTA